VSLRVIDLQKSSTSGSRFFTQHSVSGCGGIGIRARLRGVWLVLASSSLAIRIYRLFATKGLLAVYWQLLPARSLSSLSFSQILARGLRRVITLDDYFSDFPLISMTISVIVFNKYFQKIRAALVDFRLSQKPTVRLKNDRS
jgi:hypothetical protein